MDDEMKKTYTARISQANRSELVVIIYELMLESISSAKDAFGQDDLKTFDAELKRAQGLLQEMRGSLDFQYDVSHSLVSLYRYVNEQLAKSIVRRKNVNLESCERVIRGLKQSFEEVAKQDDSGPIMENTQQVYAGLTYGRDSLSEVTMYGNTANRGFRV